MSRRRAIPLLVLVVVLAAGGVLAVLLIPSGSSNVAYTGSVPPAKVSLPAFALRSYTGELVRSSELQGKVLAVTFLETQCTEACPIIASVIGQTMRQLTAAQREEIVVLAISTQPYDDTPANVRTFLRQHRAEQAMLYLIGSEEELRPVWDNFYIASALDTGDANTHSAPVRIFDRQGRWVSTLHSGADLTADTLRHDLAVALDNS